MPQAVVVVPSGCAASTATVKPGKVPANKDVIVTVQEVGADAVTTKVEVDINIGATELRQTATDFPTTLTLNLDQVQSVIRGTIFMKCKAAEPAVDLRWVHVGQTKVL